MHGLLKNFKCRSVFRRQQLIVLFYFILSLPQIVYSQALATVSGRVLDKGTRQPLAYANIIIRDKSNQHLISGTTSAQDGRFILSGIPDGVYIISCSFIGYNSYHTELYVGTLNKVFDIGTITLQQEAIQFEAVIVEGDKPAVSSDLRGKSYDIVNNISQTGAFGYFSLR